MFVTPSKWGMVVLCISCLIFYSCKHHPKVLSKEGLNLYIQDEGNGLKKSVTKNDILLSVSYRPRDLLVLQEWEHAANKDSNLLHTLKQKYAGQDYFIFELSKNNQEVIRQLGGFAQYSDLLHVLSFEMSGLVNITTNKNDTIALGDYAFEQNYGLGTANRLLFVFPAEKLKQADKYELNVREFGLNTGNLLFQFKRKDIEETPSLGY